VTSIVCETFVIFGPVCICGVTQNGYIPLQSMRVGRRLLLLGSDIMHGKTDIVIPGRPVGHRKNRRQTSSTLIGLFFAPAWYLSSAILIIVAAHQILICNCQRARTKEGFINVIQLFLAAFCSCKLQHYAIGLCTFPWNCTAAYSSSTPI
jgi:hypothetical protein